MKTLIVYYSFTGNNEILANMLQEKLGCDILKITEQKKRNMLTIMLDVLFNRRPKIESYDLSVMEYDQLILVSPIWAGKVAPPLNTFLHDERTKIDQYSFITVCGGGNDGQKEKVTQELTKVVQRKPHAVLELWLKDLAGKQINSIKDATAQKIQLHDLNFFNDKISEFLRSIETVNAV
jgi:flavodoxin